MLVKTISAAVVFILVVGTFFMFTSEEEIFLIGMLLNTFSFVAASISIWAVLALIDSQSSARFEERIEKLSNSENAIAMYYGLRVVGLCILAAGIYS